MSDRHNDEWFVSAKENFEEAIETEQWAIARAVIADLKDNGFADSAVVLERELSKAQNAL